MNSDSQKPDPSRRRFLSLGTAAMSALAAGCGSDERRGATQKPVDEGGTALPVLQPEEEFARWQQIKGEEYVEGDEHAPGVCKLPGPNAKRNWPDRDKYKDVKTVPGMCQLCSTVCGIIGYVKDGRLIKVEGNPNDPNSRGHLCARGHAALNHQYHPERLLYPLKRVGRRGEGKWKRISWDEALDEIAGKLKAIRDSGHPEDFAFHQGRQRSKDAIKRFLDAFGTSTQLSHRALCSGNRRAANLTSLWESDWDLNDVENSKYILNFGSNAFEAHQGHVAFATRIQNGRFKNGAKMVTFDVRLSNTAGASDEWFAPFPGTDGAVALAMGHVILSEDLYDGDFIDRWTNVSVDELKVHYRDYTPEWAENVSGVPAADIRRIAIEFATAAPAATTMCNRGSSAHLNGYYNDRAISTLNALVGSVGKKGGWCWSPWGGVDPDCKTPEMPKSAKTWSVLEDPPEYPLANVWRRMRVGEIVYLYLMQGRAKLKAYMTYNLDSPLTWPEESLTKEVLSNEELIPFHVTINCFYNETAHYADIILPWTTYLERWDLDARGAYNLRPYVGLRTPMVEPLGEARDIRDFFPDLAHRIGGGMEDAYQYGSVEDYMREWASAVPENPETGKAGLDRLLDEGAWENPDREPFYEPFNVPLTDAELAGAEVPDEEWGVITKNEVGIGIIQNGKPVRGFKTPSRRFEIRSLFVEKIGHNKDCSDLIASSGMTKTKNRPEQHAGHDVDVATMPIYLQLPEHENLSDDELVMTSFKWNVHNHGRTMHLKWLAEIVHSNPAWMNPATAEQFGLKDGDWIELTSYRSQMPGVAELAAVQADGDVSDSDRISANPATRERVEVGTLRVPIVTMPGIHPKAIAMSNSCGHWQYTNVAQADKSRADGEKTNGMNTDTFRDPDWERNMWWEDNSGDEPSTDTNPENWKQNTGNGWNQNQILPISPDPVTGQQAFHSTVVKVVALKTQ